MAQSSRTEWLAEVNTRIAKTFYCDPKLAFLFAGHSALKKTKALVCCITNVNISPIIEIRLENSTGELTGHVNKKLSVAREIYTNVINTPCHSEYPVLL